MKSPSHLIGSQVVCILLSHPKCADNVLILLLKLTSVFAPSTNIISAHHGSPILYTYLDYTKNACTAVGVCFRNTVVPKRTSYFVDSDHARDGVVTIPICMESTTYHIYKSQLAQPNEYFGR